MTFLGAMFDAAFVSFTAQGSSQLAMSLSHTVVVHFMTSLFIFTTSPGTGGHMNPFITMATFFAGLATLPRAVYYIIGQLLGALGGAFFLKLGLGGTTSLYPNVSSACRVMWGCPADVF